MSTMGTAPDQPPKSEQDGVWTIPTPQPAGPAEVRGRAAVSQALPEKLVEFGHASVVGLVAGQQVSEVTATGDSAATNPWEFASLEERQFVSVMRSVRSLGAPLRPQMCQPGEHASSGESQSPKSVLSPMFGHPHHLPFRALRKSPELGALLKLSEHPAMSG